MESFFDKTENVDLYIYAFMSDSGGDPRIIVGTNEFNNDANWLLLDKQSIEVILPAVTIEDLTVERIRKLQDKKKQIQAETQLELNQIEETIQSLLAIENKPGEK